MERLVRYCWPGNIRELQNVIERAVVLSRGDVLVIDEITLPKILPPPTAPANHGSLDQIERSHIVAALRKANWVINGERGAAELLGLHPNTLRSRLKKLGIKRPSV